MNHVVVLKKRKQRVGETKPLRDEVKLDLYQQLMNTPAPRYTRHAHVERARKRILFTLLYYTGARVNELREVTYNDIKGVVDRGQLKLVLHKQKDGIVRLLPTEGHLQMKKFAPDIKLFFKDNQCKVLGESFRKPGQVMHNKAWITYINNEIRKSQQKLQYKGVLSSHSFTLRMKRVLQSRVCYTAPKTHR